jgi:cobalamin biosynthesis Mg chelatase CobN
MTRVGAALALVLLTIGFVARSAPAQTGEPAQIGPPTTEIVTTVPPTAPPTTEAPGGVVTTRPAAPSPTTTVKRGASTSSTVARTTTIFTVPTPAATPSGVSPSAAPRTGTGQISGTFAVLSIVGFVVVAGLLGLQWFLTRPGRRGWTL